jgi:methionyl-tRNA formyltransferase
MNKKIAFYFMNEKGYFTLKIFIEKFGYENIDYIVSAKDTNIKKDYFKEIEALAKKYTIDFFDRLKFDATLENNFSGYKFAIGWRWIIKDNNNLIVFHDSLLPKYRGFAPLVNSLISNENRGG